MSVEHRARLAYGVLLTDKELTKLVQCDHDEPQEELAEQYRLEVTDVGDAWAGFNAYVIGPKVTLNHDAGTVDVDVAATARLLEMCRELAIEQKPQWHLEVCTF